MTVLTVNINEEKDEKALKALKAIIEAFDLNYDVEDEEQLTKEQQNEILRREVEYNTGRMPLHSIDELKAMLNYKE